MKFNTIKAFIFGSILFASISTQAAEIKVAVAANFTQTMKEISAEFEKDTKHKINLTQGATGKFYAQISNGAPFEILISADDETPAKLVKEGKAVAGTQFSYATGRLVLWSPDETLIQNDGAVLSTDKFKFIAIANAKVAPYGKAAIQTMQKMGLLMKLEPRVVQGESIAQTYQFVNSGNAQLGFVALSQVWDNGKIKSGSGWIVPDNLHEPLKQDAVLLNPGKDSPAALALLEYLRTEKAKSIIQRHGYKLP
jgi:molybdate transport system substrate-binding protein